MYMQMHPSPHFLRRQCLLKPSDLFVWCHNCQLVIQYSLTSNKGFKSNASTFSHRYKCQLIKKAHITDKPSRWFTIIRNHSIWLTIYHFILVVCSNYVCILYHRRDISTYFWTRNCIKYSSLNNVHQHRRRRIWSTVTLCDLLGNKIS